MITNFGSLYAGHVDLGDIGLEATAVNDRWFSDEHLKTIFDRALPRKSKKNKYLRCPKGSSP